MPNQFFLKKGLEWHDVFHLECFPIYVSAVYQI